MLAGALFFFGGRAITELTKTERLLARGLRIGLAVVCAVIAMLAKDAGGTTWMTKFQPLNE